MHFFYDVKVLMGYNCGGGIVFLSAIGDENSSQHLSCRAKKVFFALDFVGA